MNNIFALKVVMKLHKHNVVDLELLFCEELTIAMIVKKMRTIKLLFAIN